MSLLTRDTHGCEGRRLVFTNGKAYISQDIGDGDPVLDGIKETLVEWLTWLGKRPAESER